MIKRLNLGCGKRIHPTWTNLDLVPAVPGVTACDLSKGIPFEDCSVDVVYNSAMLEHLRREDAASFLKECHRVLKPGGIIRVGVPDLERQCRCYLQTLDAAASGKPSAEHDYDWMMLELLDQFIREKSGGGMQEFLSREDLPNEKFVLDRTGVEGREMRELIKQQKAATMPAWSAGRVFNGALRRTANVLRKCFLGARGEQALQLGRFRLSGELHQWMYDRYSLSRILTVCGFRDITVRDAHSSGISDWDSFGLDKQANGTVIKPDLIFVEASK